MGREDVDKDQQDAGNRFDVSLTTVAGAPDEYPVHKSTPYEKPEKP